MSSGDKNVSFRCIIWTNEIFFRQSDTCSFLSKGELVYKNPLKRSVLKSQFQNPRNLDKKDWFFHTIHTKTTSNSPRNKKYIKYAFTPTARGSLEVPTKYYVKIKAMWGLYQLIKYSFP